jgi:hypothetical protein
MVDGLQSWPFITFCFAIKQYELNGFVADSIIVSIVIMLVSHPLASRA